jgi:molybdopterin synthase sulfur carrier subunit
MQVKVLVFGQLTDIIKNSEILIGDVSDTDTLVEKLQKLYPEIAGSRYAIALDKKVIKENTTLPENSVIALLPPFSGG